MPYVQPQRPRLRVGDPDSTALFFPTSTITAVLNACPAGTVHLPLPPNLRGARVRVEVRLEAAASAAKIPIELRAIMRKTRDRNPFRGIGDPVAWHCEVREDAPLPGRDRTYSCSVIDDVGQS